MFLAILSIVSYHIPGLIWCRLAHSWLCIMLLYGDHGLHLRQLLIGCWLGRLSFDRFFRLVCQSVLDKRLLLMLFWLRSMTLLRLALFLL